MTPPATVSQKPVIPAFNWTRFVMPVAALSVVMVLFVSVAAYVVLTGLLSVLAGTVRLEREPDRNRFRLRRQPVWLFPVRLVPGIALVAMGAYAFTKVALGAIFYMGN